MTTLLQLGQTLSRIRQQHKLSKIELSKKSGVHRNTLHQLENGTGNVELNTLLAVCNVLGLSIHLVPDEVADHVAPEGGIKRSALSRMLDEKLHGTTSSKDKA